VTEYEYNNKVNYDKNVTIMKQVSSSSMLCIPLFLLFKLCLKFDPGGHIALNYGTQALNIFHCCTCVTIDLLHFCDVCTVQNWRGWPTGLWKWITYLLQCDIVAAVMFHATVSW